MVANPHADKHNPSAPAATVFAVAVHPACILDHLTCRTDIPMAQLIENVIVIVMNVLLIAARADLALIKQVRFFLVEAAKVTVAVVRIEGRSPIADRMLVLFIAARAFTVNKFMVKRHLEEANLAFASVGICTKVPFFTGMLMLEIAAHALTVSIKRMRYLIVKATDIAKPIMIVLSIPPTADLVVMLFIAAHTLTVGIKRMLFDGKPIAACAYSRVRFHIELPRGKFVIVDIVAARASAVRAVLVRSVDGYGAERTRADMLFLVVVIDPVADLVLMHEITASASAVGVKRMLFFHIEVTKLAPIPMPLFVVDCPCYYSMLMHEIAANASAVSVKRMLFFHILITKIAFSPMSLFAVGSPYCYSMLMHEITASASAVGFKRMGFFHILITKLAPTPMLLFVAVFPYRYGMLVLEIAANTCAVLSVLVVLLHIRCTELASSPVGGFVICPIGYGVLAGLFLAANTVARAEIVVFLH